MEPVKVLIAFICIVRQYLRQNPTVMISMSFTGKIEKSEK